MRKDTEKTTKQPTLTIEFSDKAWENLYKIQGNRQVNDKKRTSLKAIVNDIIENAKA